MHSRTPRVAALIAAPLLVVGATALVMLPRGGAAQPAASADGPTVTILRPLQDAILPLEPVVVAASAEDPDGVAAAILYVDGKKVDTALTSGGSLEQLSFEWTPKDAGDATITVRAQDSAEKWGEAVVTISVGTGVKPLPPPPTTAFATTLAPVTTEGASTAPTDPTDPTTTVAPPTSPSTATTVAPPPRVAPTSPTQPPTTPATTVPTTLPPPPTEPPTTVPPPTDPPPTEPPTTAVPTGTQNGCRLDTPAPLAPADRAAGVSTTPLFAWTYLGSCPPEIQVLHVRVGRGFGFPNDVYLSGAARSYQLVTPLPPCSEVRWDVAAYVRGAKPTHMHSMRFTTAGC